MPFHPHPYRSVKIDCMASLLIYIDNDIYVFIYIDNDIYIHLHGYCVGVVPRVNLKLVQSALSVLFTSQAIDGEYDHSKRI